MKHRTRLGQLVIGAWLTTATGLALLPSAAFAQAPPSQPFFSPLANGLNTARFGAAAAPLPDGDVLIVGGVANGQPVSSAEVYDPVNGTFTLLANGLHTARQWPVAAPLPDGDVLIAGGADSSYDALSSAELYDPSTETFTTLANGLNTARFGAVAAPLPDGDVLIAGGYNQGVLASAELYDPSTQAFTSLSNGLNTAREYAAAAPLPDGDVLIAGGYNSGFLASAETYDPSAEAFTNVNGDLNTAREHAAAAPLPDGDVLIAGGEGAGFTGLAGAELYDPATQAFTTTADLGVTRNAAVAAPLPDGDVLIAGGTNSGYLSSAEVFNPAAEAQSSGGQVGSVIKGQPSGDTPVTITNVGAQTLTISGATLTGTNAADFQVASDQCAGASLAYNQSCQLQVTLTPSVLGAETATLTLQDNEATPATVTLSGTGINQPRGSAGTAGSAGAAGASGSAGATGPAGSSGHAGAAGIVITRPAVTITGPKPGATYIATVPAARCHATDPSSPIQRCRLTTHRTADPFGYRETITARAYNRAGLSNTATLRFTVQTIGFTGQMQSGTGIYALPLGNTYQLVVISASRPDYEFAAPYPEQPQGGNIPFSRDGTTDGLPRWTLTVHLPAALHDYPAWNIGIQIDGKLTVLRLTT